MKSFKNLSKYLLPLGVLLLASSCKDPDKGSQMLPSFTNGFFVMCEGNFGSGNTSVSYYNNGTATNNLFEIANQRPLGDQGQSMIVDNNIGYILVQNSGKIEVVNAVTFKSIATIDERISSPRYMVVYNGKGYVTDWYADYVKIIDLSTYTVKDSIAVDQRPEGLLIVGSTLYVSNTGIYPDQGTKISIIDLTTDTKTGSITTPENPGGMVLDKDGNIWALCGGAWSSVDGALIKIDPDNNSIVTTVNFDQTGDYPYHLKTNGAKDQLYFTLGGQIFECPLTVTTQPSTPVIARSFYGFGINPNNDDIIGLITPDFVSSGKVVRYNSDGEKQDSAVVGIAPGSVVFK